MCQALSYLIFCFFAFVKFTYLFYPVMFTLQRKFCIIHVRDAPRNLFPPKKRHMPYANRNSIIQCIKVQFTTELGAWTQNISSMSTWLQSSQFQCANFGFEVNFYVKIIFAKLTRVRWNLLFLTQSFHSLIIARLFPCIWRCCGATAPHAPPHFCADCHKTFLWNISLKNRSEFIVGRYVTHIWNVIFVIVFYLLYVSV